jgi:very-short-patch-repair endonuclease
MPGQPHVSLDSQRERESRLRERRIAKLAERQHGVVTRDQLRESGLGEGAIDARLARRRLLPIHRGVYAVGHRGRTVEARWTAAVLALRPGAVLSHRSALALWGLGREGRAIDVTVPTNRRARDGLRVHTNALRADETCVPDHLPATTVARTLLDAAVVVDHERLARAVSEAERRGLGDSPSLPELIARNPGARGLANLRAILADERIGMDLARSELEIRFLAFIRDRDLPRPEVNVPITARGRRIVVDCLWREARLVVELDSRAHHSGWRAADADRARDFALVAAGMRTARVTWRRLHQDAGRLEAELRAVLDAGAPGPR